MPTKADLVREFSDKYGEDFLATFPGLEHQGFPGSISSYCEDTFNLVVYDPEGDLGVTVHVYMDSTCGGQFHSTGFEFSRETSILHIGDLAAEDLLFQSEDGREFLLGVLATLASNKEVEALVDRESALDLETKNKNQIFYDRKAPKEFAFLGTAKA